MLRLSADEKRTFVVVAGDSSRQKHLAEKIQQLITNSQVFVAIDAIDAIFKMENAAPHVLVTDIHLVKGDGFTLTEKVLNHSRLSECSVILIADVPDKERFVDQVVTHQVQFLTDLSDEVALATTLSRALNRLTGDSDLTYRLKFLAPYEVLFREGDSAQCVYFVKKGELQAFRGSEQNPHILGQVISGEFVGEMAHINGEPRSATVQAMQNCELIEIPRGTLDSILFSKPSWAKALMATLSKRLKRSNETIQK